MSQLNEIGEVLETHGSYATVRVLTTEGCKTCSTKDSCMLAKAGKWTITAINEAEADIGDRVKLTLGSRSYLAAGAILFLVPVILLAVFYIIARQFLTEGLAVVASLLGALIGTTIAWWIGRGKGADRFRYKIVAILPSGSDAQNEK